MIFPSYIFLLVFLPLMLTAWHTIRAVRVKLFLLTFASYIFYGWWDYRFVILMMATTILDYVCGSMIYHRKNPATRKFWLTASLAGNLGSLAFFKYYNFFVDSLQQSLSWFDVSAPLPVLNVVLPLGISFYTFQSMSYSIDIYRGKCRPTKDFLHFAAYVSMFPQLVAGPIVRYELMQKQLLNLENQKPSLERISDGLWLFAVGMAKKIWIADALAPVVALAYDGNGSPQFATAWAGTICYTFQLYFDFSAYSDMARGLGHMLGFDFLINFNSPYKSANISEFWNRWHITLSHWLRDYLFIPLGGSRQGPGATLRNLGIVMFLGGLWHGAAWNFVAWGLYHGALLIIHTSFKRLTHITLPRGVGIAITFSSVLIGWVLFRAHSLPEAADMLGAMIGLNGLEPLIYESQTLGISLPAIYGQFAGMHGLLFLAGVAAIAFIAPNSDRLPKPRHALFGILLAGFFLRTLATLAQEVPFLYFEF